MKEQLAFSIPKDIKPLVDVRTIDSSKIGITQVHDGGHKSVNRRPDGDDDGEKAA